MNGFKSAMKPEVKAKLDSILKYPFFSSVGQPLPPTVSRVDTWSQAARTCGFLKWKNSKLQARNALKGRIEARYPEDRVKHYFWHRFQEWNPLVDELRPPIIEPFVETLLKKIPLQAKYLESVRYALRSDLMLICLEIHYQDIVKPVFHLPCLDPWYAAGHFPCGWDGDEFPEQWDGVIRGGQLIVF
jgi:hypothetical protein